MSSDHSTLSYEKSRSIDGQPPTRGTHKVKYQPSAEWDFQLDSEHLPIDLSLILPHYRARGQPIEHRMAMFAESQSSPVKLRVCRNSPRTRFHLEVQGGASDVTLWLPSDFKGQIYHAGKATFSAGFINRILRRARVNEPDGEERHDEDDVVVITRGRITFKMWDVQTSSPENTHKESLKRIFGCSWKAPETAIDWDCLLRD